MMIKQKFKLRSVEGSQDQEVLVFFYYKVKVVHSPLSLRIYLFKKIQVKVTKPQKSF